MITTRLISHILLKPPIKGETGRNRFLFFNVSVIVFLASISVKTHKKPSKEARLKREPKHVTRRLSPATETQSAAKGNRNRQDMQAKHPDLTLKAQSTAIPAMPETAIRANKQQSEERWL